MNAKQWTDEELAGCSQFSFENWIKRLDISDRAKRLSGIFYTRLFKKAVEKELDKVYV